MNAVAITINGKTFKMVFSLKVFRSLGKVWGFETLDEVVQRVQTIEQLQSGSLAAFDTFFDIIHEAINCCSENREKISKEEVEELSLEDMKLLASAIAGGTTDSFTIPATGEKKTKPKKPTV
jgi:hypothetical protein